jgi:hypothetical protein
VDWTQLDGVGRPVRSFAFAILEGKVVFSTTQDLTLAFRVRSLALSVSRRLGIGWRPQVRSRLGRHSGYPAGRGLDGACAGRHDFALGRVAVFMSIWRVMLAVCGRAGRRPIGPPPTNPTASYIRLAAVRSCSQLSSTYWITDDAPASFRLRSAAKSMFRLRPRPRTSGSTFGCRPGKRDHLDTETRATAGFSSRTMRPR